MKILVFGDIHMGDHRAFAKPDSECGTTRIRAIFDSLSWILELRANLHPDLVVCLGDLIHMPREADHRLLVMLAEFFDFLGEGLPPRMVQVLVGNHDTCEHPFAQTSYKWCVQRLVSRGCGLINQPVCWEDPGIWFLPYYRNLEVVLEHPRRARIIFCHTDVQEHPYGGRALGPSVEDFVAPYVFSGHVHQPQVVSEGWGVPFQARFEYVGALLPTSFADAGDLDFGALLLEVEERDKVKSTRLINPFAVPFIKQKVMEGEEPMLRDDAYLLVDLRGGSKWCGEQAEKLREEPNVRVRCHVEETEVPAIEKEDPLEGEGAVGGYVDGLIDRWAAAKGGDPARGRRLYRGEDDG